MKPWVLAALCATALGATTARADETRAFVDQVTLEPSILGGNRLQVTLSIVTLTGQHVELAEGATVKLVVNNSKQDVPYALGSYGQTAAETAIVFVIQTSVDFTEVLPVITEAIDSNVLAVLNEKASQVAVLSFGEAQGPGKLQPVKTARGKVTGVASDGSVGEPVLLDTIDRALTLLRKAKTEPEGRPIRKLIVVVSDGRDVAHDKERVIRVGQRAAKEGVRIHSFAYSPKDVRKPLLLLGELSKRSRGTFRWVRGAKADSWTPAFQQLGDEIKLAHVLSFWFPAGEEVSGKLRLEISGRTEVATTDVKIPDAECTGQTCEPGMYCVADRCVMPREPERRGVLGWILLIGGIAVAAIVVLGFIGFIMTRRQEAAAIRAKLPPGVVPPVAHKSKQPTQFPPVPSTMPSTPPSGARFVVMSGPLQGREIGITHGMQIGKAPTCQLVIDDGYASTYHAQCTVDHLGKVHLYDSGSTNGTFVNGERVTVSTLEHGAAVRIGSTELRFLAQ